MYRNLKIIFNKNKQYHTNLTTIFLKDKYSKLTCDNGNHKDAMLVTNKSCRTLALLNFTNYLRVVN